MPAITQSEIKAYGAMKSIALDVLGMKVGEEITLKLKDESITLLRLSEETKEPKEKWYLVAYEINSGGAEHIIQHTLRAKSMDEAGEKAEKWMSDFFLDPRGYKEDEAYYRGDGSEAISLSGIDETTLEGIARSLKIGVK